MKTFRAKIDIIGVNPFVLLPAEVLEGIFKAAGRDKGPIPVKGTINGQPFVQTLVKYSGKWRLYINASMLKAARACLDDEVKLKLKYDPEERRVPFHPKLETALKRNPAALAVFNRLSPSRRKEIVRYISFLKTEASVDRNVQRAMDFLAGKARFIGRDTP